MRRMARTVTLYWRWREGSEWRRLDTIMAEMNRMWTLPDTTHHTMRCGFSFLISVSVSKKNINLEA